MEIPQETEDYIRELIDHTVGLPVSTTTLLNKLRSVEAAQEVLQDQYLCLQSKLKEKDDLIERFRAEASRNALALKKLVEENQKLAMEGSNLLESYKKENKKLIEEVQFFKIQSKSLLGRRKTSQRVSTNSPATEKKLRRLVVIRRHFHHQPV